LKFFGKIRYSGVFEDNKFDFQLNFKLARRGRYLQQIICFKIDITFFWYSQVTTGTQFFYPKKVYLVSIPKITGSFWTQPCSVFTRNDYIFCSDRAFFRPFCSYLGLRGSSPIIWASYVSSWRNTLVGGAKIPVKKKPCLSIWQC